MNTWYLSILCYAYDAWRIPVAPWDIKSTAFMPSICHCAIYILGIRYVKWHRCSSNIKRQMCQRIYIPVDATPSIWQSNRERHTMTESHPASGCAKESNHHGVYICEYEMQPPFTRTGMYKKKSTHSSLIKCAETKYKPKGHFFSIKYSICFTSFVFPTPLFYIY